jgi:hypothetical protein
MAIHVKPIRVHWNYLLALENVSRLRCANSQSSNGSGVRLAVRAGIVRRLLSILSDEFFLPQLKGRNVYKVAVGIRL